MFRVVILPPLGGVFFGHGLPPVSSVASPNFGDFGRCAPPYADHPRARIFAVQNDGTNLPIVGKKYSKLARIGNIGLDRKLIICNDLFVDGVDYQQVLATGR
jgi:hypothetical protein